VLKNSSGNIVGFANEMPQAKMLKRITIDLMRADKEYEGAMAFCYAKALSRYTQTTIQNLILAPYRFIARS
jgi:lysylphosphatidylglycerol synthetase-like protein (DUF2156 family)